MAEIEINHTNYDVTQNKVPIIQVEQVQWSNLVNKALNKLNSKLKYWLKSELLQTKKQQEKNVLDILLNWEYWKDIKKDYPEWISINLITDNIFAFINKSTWNINYFVSNEWKILFWLWNIRERSFIHNWKALKLAWYKEKKENWLNNMYKIIWWKESWPIDINSFEYYKAWLDILFNADILNKMLRLKHNKESDKLDIRLFIKHWSFKYEDLELFLERWLITKEIFDYWLEEMKKIIINQCSDKRLINLTWYNKESLWIKESDLKRYLEAWYIDWELAKQCYDVLSEKMKDLTN